MTHGILTSCVDEGVQGRDVHIPDLFTCSGIGLVIERGRVGPAAEKSIPRFQRVDLLISRQERDQIRIVFDLPVLITLPHDVYSVTAVSQDLFFGFGGLEHLLKVAVTI